jgi:hypothetical protein
MKILAIEQEIPGFTAEAFASHLQAEAARVWELYQAGIFREIYFRQDCSEAVLMLEWADMSEAETVLHTLPLVKAGLITFELIPLKPYPGFAQLFAAEAESD